MKGPYRDQDGKQIEYEGECPDWSKWVCYATEPGTDDDGNPVEIQLCRPYTAEETALNDRLYRRERQGEQILDALSALVNAGNFTDAQALAAEAFYDGWRAGVEYRKGDIRRYTGRDGSEGLYRYVAADPTVSTDSWNPEDAHSLWVRIREPGGIAEWEPVQPGVNEAYRAGDKVTHNGRAWQSDIDNNTWEPGVYGWTDLGPAES